MRSLMIAALAGAAFVGAISPAAAQPYGPPPGRYYGPPSRFYGPPPGWVGPHYWWHGQHWHNRAWMWDRYHRRGGWRYY